jgi:alpha-L-rhamnosidase
MSPWPYAALERANAAKCTYYFSYYKHIAMQPDDYMAQLGPWKEMIEDGLTTFAENPEPTRSDCHAWSAHPILGFFQIVAGVTSTAINWRKARIAPRPGSLRRFDARIAHPDGELRVLYEEDRLIIDTPVPAELVWKGKTKKIKPGRFEV